MEWTDIVRIGSAIGMAAGLIVILILLCCRGGMADDIAILSKELEADRAPRTRSFNTEHLRRPAPPMQSFQGDGSVVRLENVTIAGAQTGIYISGGTDPVPSRRGGGDDWGHMEEEIMRRMQERGEEERRLDAASRELHGQPPAPIPPPRATVARDALRPGRRALDLE